MDDLDFRILRDIRVYAFWGGQRDADAHRSTEIAGRLGVTAKTVNDRLAAMRASGIVGRHAIVPNLSALGLTESFAYYWLRPGDEARAQDPLSRLEGVCGASLFFGGGLGVDLYSRDTIQLARRLRRVRAVLGRDPFARFERRVPPPAALSLRDLGLLRALRRAGGERPPHEALASAANALGVSFRTAKRHYARMAHEGSFDVECRVAVADLRSSLFVTFVVTPAGQDASIRPAILRLVDQAVFHDERNDAGQLLVQARLVRPGEGSALQGSMLAIPGVARVDLLCQYGERTFDATWIDDALARAIGQKPTVSVRESVASRGGQDAGPSVRSANVASR